MYSNISRVCTRHQDEVALVDFFSLNTNFETFETFEILLKYCKQQHEKMYSFLFSISVVLLKKFQKIYFRALIGHTPKSCFQLFSRIS